MTPWVVGRYICSPTPMLWYASADVVPSRSYPNPSSISSMAPPRSRPRPRPRPGRGPGPILAAALRARALRYTPLTPARTHYSPCPSLRSAPPCAPQSDPPEECISSQALGPHAAQLVVQVTMRHGGIQPAHADDGRRRLPRGRALHILVWCHVTHETRVCNVDVDLAGIICQAL